MYLPNSAGERARVVDNVVVVVASARVSFSERLVDADYSHGIEAVSKSPEPRRSLNLVSPSSRVRRSHSNPSSSWTVASRRRTQHDEKSRRGVVDARRVVARRWRVGEHVGGAAKAHGL